MTDPSDQPTQIMPTAVGDDAAADAAPAAAATPAAGTAADRTYPVDPARTLQTVHDILATSATFTLDREDAQNGVVEFHDFDDARYTLAVAASAQGGTELRMSSVGDRDGRRGAEFYATLDRHMTMTMAAPAAGPTTAGAANGTADTRRLSKAAVLAVIVAVPFLLLSFISLDLYTWGLLVFFTVLPAALSAIAMYTTRRSGPRRGRVLAYVAAGITAVAVVLGAGGIIWSGIKEKADHEALEKELAEERAAMCASDYEWPTTGMGALLPAPQSTKGEVSSESSDYLYVEVCGVDDAAWNDYVKAVQGKGFTVDYSKTDDHFSADDANGNHVSLSLDSDEKIMSVTVSAPDEEDGTDDASSDNSSTDTGDTSADTGTTTTDGSAADQPAPSTSADGVDPTFKDAMDSYESMMNEYVDFMTKYDQDGQPLSMAADYAQIMVKYSDAMQKLDAIDENSLSDAELQYYLEVTARVAQKLATVAQ
ncbi:DUF6591 domain-containing protein [Bifidobacterium samirii]|uniref:DUF6591 domain-containing protein n=1 Tax=Bifidobacterium samirii TaxID=2306974 RepID=A0A430FGV5_9BIFI|nr:DUF6591 domain-containing protein [Bifidobacterium samirii]RSX52104.1 hypothetical protein D2E24_1833 [Bifidobacterium samirii]